MSVRYLTAHGSPELTLKTPNSQPWHPTSWQSFPITQNAEYPDNGTLKEVIAELSHLPPLVSEKEVNQLRQALAKAASGECFILQGGDCAETFNDCNAATITNKLKILLQMHLVLMQGLDRPVVKVGRMAGQYAKPRSTAMENRGGQSLPSYRGDLINGADYNEQSRIPDPKRLLKGYSFASLTLNYIRTLIENHFTDFSQTENWDLGFLQHSPVAQELQKTIADIDVSQLSESHSYLIDKVFTSHEALHLHYEQALTRQVADGSWFNLSTHLPWIGMRTAALDSAHVEYMRGISNPIGIKISSSMDETALLELCRTLNPKNELGRLVLITRFGINAIDEQLPDLIRAIQRENLQVVWVSDPMHGNTLKTPTGIKTRHFEDVLGELKKAFEIHEQLNSHLAGVHFELTGDNVTECIGGARGLTEADLQHAYKSLVDPRLNAEQALEMAMQIVRSQSHRQGDLNDSVIPLPTIQQKD